MVVVLVVGSGASIGRSLVVKVVVVVVVVATAVIAAEVLSNSSIHNRS